MYLYFSGDFDEESDEMVERDWNEYWRMLFKPITVKDISDYEKKYKGIAKKKFPYIEAAFLGLEYIDITQILYDMRVQNIS